MVSKKKWLAIAIKSTLSPLRTVDNRIEVACARKVYYNSTHLSMYGHPYEESAASSCKNLQIFNSSYIESSLRTPNKLKFKLDIMHSKAVDNDNFTPTPERDVSTNQIWQLLKNGKELSKDDINITFTNLEAKLLTTMLRSNNRVISKEDLIRSIGKDPDEYKGIEMSLCRMQRKFKISTNGDFLFRSVRNRGYCLTQELLEV